MLAKNQSRSPNAIPQDVHDHAPQALLTRRRPPEYRCIASARSEADPADRRHSSALFEVQEPTVIVAGRSVTRCSDNCSSRTCQGLDTDGITLQRPKTGEIGADQPRCGGSLRGVSACQIRGGTALGSALVYPRPLLRAWRLLTRPNKKQSC